MRTHTHVEKIIPDSKYVRATGSTVPTNHTIGGSDRYDATTQSHGIAKEFTGFPFGADQCPGEGSGLSVEDVGTTRPNAPTNRFTVGSNDHYVTTRSH